MTDPTIPKAAAALAAACDAVVAAKDTLTKADQAIGDGDHGLGMARGFGAAAAALRAEDAAFTTVGEVFSTAGTAVLETSGGASGAIFGTMLRAPRKAVPGEVLDGGALATALTEGAAKVAQRGKAAPGDKTMLDALVPAAEAARAAADGGAGLPAVARAAADAAAAGRDATADMVAKFGKAKSLGERSLGHPDPGAMSVAILLTALADAIDAA